MLWRGIAPAPCVAHVGGVDARRSVRGEVRFRQYAVQPELRTLRGIPVTSPAQTFLDLADGLEFVELLVLGDSLIHRTDLTASGLRTAAAHFHGHRTQFAREVAAACRDDVESARETRARLLIMSAGLPEPTANLVVTLPDNRWRRIDLTYPRWKLGIEYDGRHHIEREEQWERDILRREELEALGWRFVVLTNNDLYRTPATTLRRIVDAIEQLSGVRPTIAPGWLRYFPQVGR